MIVVLDARVLIAYLENSDAHFGAAVRLLQDAADRGDALAMSPVSLAEVLVGPVRDGTHEQVLEAVAELSIGEVPLPPDAAKWLARLRATGLKMPDCCVLLAATTAQAAVASFDERLVRAAIANRIPIRPTSSTVDAAGRQATGGGALPGVLS